MRMEEILFYLVSIIFDSLTEHCVILQE